MSNHEGLEKARHLITQVSPEFTELTADLNEVMQTSEKNPMLVAALLFKLAQERQKTNQLIEKMEQKYDELAFHVKTQSPHDSHDPLSNTTLNSISLLPDADQKIMKLVEENQKVDAKLVKERLGYKNPNAASQRLNALAKAGYLGKIQSGKKVVFIQKG